MAASEGLRLALLDIDTSANPDNLVVWLAFDSRALLDSLEAPWSRLQDSSAIEAASRALEVASRVRELHVLWVPSHCGIAGNEAADRAAADGADLDQPDTTIPLPTIAALLTKEMEAETTRRYLAATDPNSAQPVALLHRAASDGGRAPTWEGLTRKEATTLTQLRLNRAPFLEHTRHRWGLSDSPICRCGEADETTAHYLLHCPIWETQRRTTFGTDRELSILQFEMNQVLAFHKACVRP